MPFTHTTGVYNVQATLFAWLAGQLTTNKPPLISSVVVTTSLPEEPLVAPCFSVHFLGTFESAQPWQGRATGGGELGARNMGIMEVNCWVSRADVNWRAQLAQMEDAVTYSHRKQASAAIIIKDFYANAATPADTVYRVVLEELEKVVVANDPNPDIERKRILIHFQWIERA